MTGAPNGASAQQAYDRWFRYPAGFSVETLQRCFDAAGDIARDELLADPFCGAATVGTAHVARGGRFVGLEAHPLLVDLARTKLRVPPLSPRRLAHAARAVADRSGTPACDDEPELVRRCFDGKTLSTLCGLRCEIASEGAWRPYLTWALLGTLRDVANARVGWPYQRPAVERQPIHKDARERFVQRATQIAADLSEYPLIGSGRVRLVDSRRRSAWTSAFGEMRIRACITSSPYLNNFDYADATRLELYFLGQVTSWQEMCDSARTRMLVATTQQSRVALAKRDSARLRRIPGVDSELADLVERLEKERTRRPRGKEYDRLLPSYLSGINRVLENLANHLAPKARLVWVIGDSAPYGIYIDTPGLIATMARTHGLKLIENERLRTRGTRWRTNGMRHRIALEERMLVFTPRR